MALTKVTKHIVFGSTLIAHYGRDISDTTSSSSSLTQWGEDGILGYELYDHRFCI